MDDTMQYRKIMIVLVLTAVLLSSFPAIQSADSDGDTSSKDYLLFDDGNGSTKWTEISASNVSLDQTVKAAADLIGIEYSYSGGSVTIGDKTSTVVGGTDTGGSFVVSGTTGVTVTSSWELYSWNADASSWEATPLSKLNEIYISGSYALGFYPDGTKPVETPVDRTSWTMIRGNALQDGNQESTFTETSEAEIVWTDSRGGQSGVYSSVLYANGLVFVRFGTGDGMGTGTDCSLRCHTTSGELLWEFSYPGIQYYETTTPVIAGDYIYAPGGLGYIFKIPWKTGPGDGNCDVTTFNNAPYNEEDVKEKVGAIPYSTGATLIGSTYSTGPGSLVYSDGAIYCECSNGMVYCFDMGLNLIWSSQMGGHTYYVSPTVCDGYVFTGALDGNLYAIDASNGTIIDSELVYHRELYRTYYGLVSIPSVMKSQDGYTLFFSVSDGRGMSSQVGGLGIYWFNESSLNKVYLNTEDFGLVSNYLVRADTESFHGVMFASTNGIFRIDAEGAYKLLNGELAEIHAPPVIVNGERLYLASYTAGKPLYILDLDGTLLSQISPPREISNYNMSPMTVIDDWIFVGNDSGTYALYGVLPDYVPPVEDTAPWWEPFAVFAGIVVILLVSIYLVLRLVFKKEKPYAYLSERINHYLKGDDMLHNTRSRHRLLAVLSVGIVSTVLIFLLCLCVGSSATLSVEEAVSALISAINKNGQNLTYNEVIVYSSRLPRAMAAFAVGVGLSIAGSVYQAIIRNPLVDPYIMGVSSGAGTAAIAVIAFDFTFFGLFSPHSIYLTAAAAMVGGLIAFFITMLIAEKAGGSSLNYVLAGVVVGLAFSAVQSLMMSMAGDKINDTLTWLFGSFSNVSWTQVWIIVIPALALAFVPLVWAKEFNLVLLGEDQAKQMGLDVRKFNRMMLILASVLTAICVAFVGIIGFVGLVVPHLCRMILGGDHRLVLPSSIVVGGILMMLADFASRMILIGQELPVGAITTIIGVPVFAYLLIKKGRMYDG